MVTIGRDPANDLVTADDPRASRRHAELRLRPDRSWELRDLDSHNGTFVNGERTDRAVLSDGDIVSVGNHVFRFRDGQLEEFSYSDDTSLDVAGIKVRVGNTTLLDDVAFSIPSRSVLAVVGPSGAGKSTLLRAMTGFAAPDEGTVRFASRDLYASYDELRNRIGYVPQDDLVHPQLTTRQELEYAGALRLPPDLGQQGLLERVNQVTHELGLTPRADLQVAKLSGGQRKRVSVGIELLTQPALLFLDEPTSGLDPGNEHQVMSVLRQLADGGRIVVVVTHATQSLDLVDRVLFLSRGGKMAFFGPPAAALDYFARHGVRGGYAEIFRVLENPGEVDWAAEFPRRPRLRSLCIGGHPPSPGGQSRRPCTGVSTAQPGPTVFAIPDPDPPPDTHSQCRSAGFGAVRRATAGVRSTDRPADPFQSIEHNGGSVGGNVAVATCHFGDLAGCLEYGP